VDAFHKPAVVLSIADGLAHGSCRSIAGFDMLDALERCADLFERFGGHKQAAGLSMEAGRVAALRQRLASHADQALSPDDLRPRLHLDAALPLPEITPDLVASVLSLAPFGMANPRPVFDAPAVEIVGGPTIMKERHLRMTVRQSGRLFRAVAWRAAGHLALLEEHRQRIDLAYSVVQNTWQGDVSIELEVADARPPVT
jgi:single-stranded-DNA-specific exonuclease